MQHEYTTKLLSLHAAAREDPYYLSALEELRETDKRFLRALEDMAPDHRDAVMDHMGAVHAVNQRLQELSLMIAEKS